MGYVSSHFAYVRVIVHHVRRGRGVFETFHYYFVSLAARSCLHVPLAISVTTQPIGTPRVRVQGFEVCEDLFLI